MNQPTTPNTALTQQLREYAANNCYSHGDYADTMRQAADRIAELEARTPAATERIKVDIELPDGDKREVKIMWQEVRDGKLCLCVKIMGDTPAAPVVAEGLTNEMVAAACWNVRPDDFRELDMEVDYLRYDEIEAIADAVLDALQDQCLLAGSAKGGITNDSTANFAAPAAPTDAKADDLSSEVWEGETRPGVVAETSVRSLSHGELQLAAQQCDAKQLNVVNTPRGLFSHGQISDEKNRRRTLLTNSAAQSVRDAAQPTAATAVALVPKWEGEFKNFEQWVNKAQSWLTSPSHRPAVCIDAMGRRCAIGKDFMLARDEGAFPVRFFWECQPIAPGKDKP